MTSFTANPTNSSSSSSSTPSLAAMLAADVQPAILLRSARRVRHLHRIVLRHLDLPSFHSIMFPSVGMYYTLSRNEQYTPFYCSTIIPTTLNPSWDYVDDHQLTDIGTSAQPQARYVVDTSQPPVGTLTKIVCKIWVRQNNNEQNNNESSATTTSTETSTETSTSTTTSVSSSPASPPSTFTFSSLSPSTSSTSTSCGYTDHCILHYPINMTRLERLLPTLYLPSLPSLPPNTLLVFLVDGIYSTRDVREAVGRPIVAAPVDERMPSKKIDVNDSLISCTNLIRASTSLHHVESQVAQLCSQIEQLLQEKAQRKKKLCDAEFRRQRVRELQAIVKQEQEALTQERVRVCSFRRALLPRGEALSEQHQQLIQQTTTLEQAKLTLQYQKKIALRNATIKLEARRRKLISQLMTVYPIARSKQQPINDKVKHYTIKGIRLPTTQLATYDEEQVSTALGYVCHLVFLIAKYLDLPLRYRVMYRASRSAICDDVHANQQHIFPLYFKNTEEKRFECACILLNKNIEHLLNVRVPDWHRLAQHSQNTLENLDILLATEVPR